MKRVVRAGVGVALLGLLVALAWGAGGRDSSRESAGAADGAPAGVEAGERTMTYEIDTRESWVVAVTEKAGALGFLGHQHAVIAIEWEAEIDWRPDEPGASRATVTVSTAGLRIDTERGRELADLDEGPSADDVAELQEKILSAENLAASEHPEIRLEVTGLERARGGDLELTARLTLRGRTRTVRFPVKVEPGRAGDTTYFSGSFTVKQTDFGIEPESIAGVVKVADPVDVRFRVAVRSR